MKLFNKKLPAWMLLAALVIVGAGAATGLVLKDQITGTTTIAVSQALAVETPDPYSTAAYDGDEFLGTVNDNGVEWAVHFEANNGDILRFALPIYNWADQAMVAQLTIEVPEGLSMDITDSGDVDNVVQVSPTDYKFSVAAAATGDGADDTWASGEDGLLFEIAIEDAQPTGFYEISAVMYPVNV